MKRFIVKNSFWNILPHATFGVVVAHNMREANEIPPADQSAITQLLDQANTEAKRYLVSEVISQNPSVSVWREAYQTFKTKKGARASVENLLKRVLKNNPVGHISPVVDLYNSISLKYAMCVGGEDLDAIEGDIQLGIPGAGLDFQGLGEDKSEPTLENEVCYYDDAGAICRCWNWRDGQRTALRDDSHTAFFIVENVEAQRIDELHEATDELAELLEKYLGAQIFAKRIITRDAKEMTLSD